MSIAETLTAAAGWRDYVSGKGALAFGLLPGCALGVWMAATIIYIPRIVEIRDDHSAYVSELRDAHTGRLEDVSEVWADAMAAQQNATERQIGLMAERIEALERQVAALRERLAPYEAEGRRRVLAPTMEGADGRQDRLGVPVPLGLTSP